MIGLIIALILAIIVMYAAFTYFTPRYVQLQRVLTSRDMWLVSGTGTPPFHIRLGKFSVDKSSSVPSGTVIYTRYNGEKMYESESTLNWKRVGDTLVAGELEFAISNIYGLKPVVRIRGGISSVSPWSTTLVDV
jgi:hypothetical protein